MGISRRFNKQRKRDIIAIIQEKQYNRYNKIREEYKDKSIDELVEVLKNKKMSKTDTYAVTHTLMKLREDKDNNNDNTDTDNTLSGEDSSIKEEKS